MTVNVTYREAGAVVPGATTIKNSPLSNGEIDGNFKSVKDAVEVLSTSAGAGLVGFAPTGDIAATTVQGAIAELDSEKVNTANLAAPTGSSLVGHLPAGTGAIATTLQEAMRPFVHIKHFGGVADGVTDNTQAFRKALAVGGIINLDEGVYWFNHTSNVASIIDGIVLATKSFKLIGKGKGKTILADGQSTVTYAGNFLCIAEGVSAEFEDLTFQGPLTKPTSGSACPNLYGVGIITSPSGSEILMRNVSFTGWFSQNIYKHIGNNATKFLIDIRNCEFQSYQTCIGAFDQNDANGSIRVFDSILWEGSIPPGDPGFPFAHPVYVHPNINLHFERVRFVKWHGLKYAVHHFSQDGKTSVYAKRTKFIDVRFEADNSGEQVYGVETSDVMSTDFIRCYFAPNIIRVVLAKPTGTLLDDCEFPGTIQNSTTGGNVTVRGGKMTHSSVSSSLAYNGNWLFEGVKLYASNTLATPFIQTTSTVTDPSISSLKFRGCDFFGVSSIETATRMIQLEGALPVEISGGCTVSGRFGRLPSKYFLMYNNANCVLNVHGNTFNVYGVDTSEGLMDIQATPNDGNLNIFDNKYSEQSVIRHGVGANTKQNFALPNRTKFDAVASSSTLTLFVAYDTYYVSGTTVITNIVLPLSAHKFLSGKIRLIATGVWSTSNTGNIVPKTTSARTVNDIVELVWDPVASVWREV